MFSVRRPDETVDEVARVAPTDLIALSELAAEAFGWGQRADAA